jgi:hypothetical protein
MMEMNEVIILNTEHMIAIRPDMRAIPVRPGNVMSVTEALRMTAA